MPLRTHLSAAASKLGPHTALKTAICSCVASYSSTEIAISNTLRPLRPRPRQDYPCFKCKAHKLQIFNFDEAWVPWTHEDYVHELQKCLVQVCISQADAHRVFTEMGLDFRADGMHGRTLTRNVTVTDIRTGTAVQLLKWDRLELGGSVQDIHCQVADLHECETVELAFWRKSPEVPFKFWPAVMSVLGFRLEYLMLDVLHMLDLGVTARLSGHIVHCVLQDGTKFRNKNTVEGWKQGLVLLNRSLRAWYRNVQRELRAAETNRLITMVGKVTLNMLSLGKKRDVATLKAKGAESRHFLPFAISLLTPDIIASLNRRGMNGEALCGAAVALQSGYDVMRQSPRNLLAADLQEPQLRCGRLSVEAGVPLLPKFHFLPHIADGVATAGNPQYYSTYEDESHNRDVVAIIRSCHLREFAARCLAKAELLTRLERNPPQVCDDGRIPLGLP